MKESIRRVTHGVNRPSLGVAPEPQRLPARLGYDPPMLCAGLLLALLSSTATPRPVVTVLYFDNNTNDRSYDVLQKGLADMLITDLSAVEAIQVVERAKLDQLIRELS